MEKNCYIKYFKVSKNDTAVTEISTNDFKPVALNRFKRGMPVFVQSDDLNAGQAFNYSLLSEKDSFYGYLEKAVAMERAKSGALIYINSMIREIEAGIAKLIKYRIDHYDDLNRNLLDENIKKFRKAMHIK